MDELGLVHASLKIIPKIKKLCVGNFYVLQTYIWNLIRLNMERYKDFIPNNLDYLKYGLGSRGLIGQHEQDI
jgi:hypothetical protein